MTHTLTDASKRWLALLGVQDERGALHLFCEEIIPLILPGMWARFAADYPNEGGHGRYGGLVSLLGYTPDTTILAARFTAAKSLVVLHTAETAPFMADIRAESGLKSSSIHEITFEREPVEGVATALESALRLLEGVRPVAVEMTGGTKPMATVAHVAAARLGVDTLYLDYGRYDARYRKPLPETVYVRLLRTPLLPHPVDRGAIEARARLHALHRDIIAMKDSLRGAPEIDIACGLARLAEEVQAVMLLLGEK